MVTNREVLTAAADLIESKGWCQGWFAKDALGRKVNSWSEDASCFCCIGAIGVAVGERGGYVYEAATDFLSDNIEGFISVADFNDAPGRTAAEVIAKLREVAALPEAA